MMPSGVRNMCVADAFDESAPGGGVHPRADDRAGDGGQERLSVVHAERAAKTGQVPYHVVDDAGVPLRGRGVLERGSHPAVALLPAVAANRFGSSVGELGHRSAAGATGAVDGDRLAVDTTGRAHDAFRAARASSSWRAASLRDLLAADAFSTDSAACCGTSTSAP